jgi:ribosomal protein S18 acetylase RimI-like enzyme
MPEGLSSYSVMVEIRPYQDADAAAIAGLVSVLGYPVGTDEMRSRLAALSPDHHTLVAQVGDELAGFIGLAVIQPYESSVPFGFILALAVDPDHQRQGIGTALVRAAEGYFQEQGVGDIRVSSGLHREEAHRFYEAAGYAKTGFRFRQLLTDEG